MLRGSAVLVAVVGVLGNAEGMKAQALKDVQTPDTPLVLKAQGSFFVGGEKADQTKVELGDLGPGGHITVNQMYVRYMVPVGGDGHIPVVMVHGATLTGKSWETTPDGRMGWGEYFVRKGHPVYVPDQEQIKTLATIPILVVFGDHRDAPTGISTRPSWQISFDSCQELIGRIKSAGGSHRCSTRRTAAFTGTAT